MALGDLMDFAAVQEKERRVMELLKQAESLRLEIAASWVEGMGIRLVSEKDEHRQIALPEAGTQTRTASSAAVANAHADRIEQDRVALELCATHGGVVRSGEILDALLRQKLLPVGSRPDKILERHEQNGWIARPAGSKKGKWLITEAGHVHLREISTTKEPDDNRWMRTEAERIANADVTEVEHDL